MYINSSEPPYFDQSRMSKAWVAANFDTLNRQPYYSNQSAATTVPPQQHVGLQPSLSNISNMSRHSQMTNYTTQRPTLNDLNRQRGGGGGGGSNLAPPLVTSTPYTKIVSQPPPLRLSSGTATISYNPRNNISQSPQRYYQREDARALWQPPTAPQPSRDSTLSRQPVVAFKKTPIFYEPQKGDDDANYPPPASVYHDAGSYYNAPIGLRSAPLAKKTFAPPPPKTPAPNNYSTKGSLVHSSGGSCCSSCCSLNSSSHDECSNKQKPKQTQHNSRNLAPAPVPQQHHVRNDRSSSRPRQPSRGAYVESSCDDSSFSCSSTCSTCSCHNNGPHKQAQHQQQQPAPTIMKQRIESKTLTRPRPQQHQKPNAERRRTIGANPSDIRQAVQIYSFPKEDLTPTPRPPSAVYCNEAALTLERPPKSKTAINNQPPPAPSPISSSYYHNQKPRSHPDNYSRDSGLGATTPASQTLVYAQDFGAHQQSSMINQQHLIRDPSAGSIRSSQSSSNSNRPSTANNKVPGKTIVVAGDSYEKQTLTTLYATSVQTPATVRSTRNSTFLRLEEVKDTSATLPKGEAFARNSSFSSSVASSSSEMMKNVPSHKRSAGGQVHVGNNATKVVPVPGPNPDRFIWVDAGVYDEGESSSPVVAKPPINTQNLNNRKPNNGQQPIQAAIVPPQYRGPINNDEDRPRIATVTRKHSSFFRNILTSLFGIRPRLHSDGDVDDPSVNTSIQRRSPNRSASAVFMRNSLSKLTNSNKNKDRSSDGRSGKFSFFSASNNAASNDRNRTWHGLKGNKQAKPDARQVFESDQIQHHPQHALKLATSSSTLNNKSAVVNVHEEDAKSTYTMLSRDDGSSTLGRQPSSSQPNFATMSRPISRGTSLASTLKSNRNGPLFLVKKRVSSTNQLVEPIPPAAPGTTDPKTGESAVIANVEQLLAMARVHPQLEYEWIPDDYFI